MPSVQVPMDTLFCSAKTKFDLSAHKVDDWEIGYLTHRYKGSLLKQQLHKAEQIFHTA